MPKNDYSTSLVYSENPILRQTFEFSIAIVKYSEILESSKKYIIARQLLKAGTSIGANVKEAQNAESKADFVHKMKIALKEADETEYWLNLCNCIDGYPSCIDTINQLTPIIKILNKIIGTSKRNTGIR